MITIELTGD